MFEKEAEEYCTRQELLEDVRDNICNAFEDGAGFGYNKANEWHFVKDGDLPNKELEEKQLLVRVRNYTEDFILAYYMLDKYYSKNGKRFYFDIDCDTPINTKDIIAWEEIVPPELPKESECQSSINS